MADTLLKRDLSNLLPNPDGDNHSLFVRGDGVFALPELSDLGVGESDSPSFAGLTLTGNALMQKSGPAFISFYRTGLAKSVRAHFGELGSGEANVSINMNYTSGVHRLDDVTANALWLAMHEGAWAMQRSRASSSYGDVWDIDGNEYCLFQYFDGRMVLNTTLAQITAGGYVAMLTVPRNGGAPSIAGYSDLVLEGARTPGLGGIVYINTYGAGNVNVCNGGGSLVIGGLTPSAKLDVQRTGLNGQGGSLFFALTSDARSQNDEILQVFQAKNSANAFKVYGRVRMRIDYESAGLENSSMHFDSCRGGVTTSQLSLLSNGTAVFSGPVVGMKNVVDSPAGALVSAGDPDSVFTNAGATARSDFTLPTAVKGLVYTFTVLDSHGIKVIPNTGDTIQIGASESGSGSAGAVECSTIAASVKLLAVSADKWVAVEATGTWTVS